MLCNETEAGFGCWDMECAKQGDRKTVFVVAQTSAGMRLPGELKMRDGVKW